MECDFCCVVKLHSLDEHVEVIAIYSIVNDYMKKINNSLLVSTLLDNTATLILSSSLNIKYSQLSLIEKIDFLDRSQFQK